MNGLRRFQLLLLSLLCGFLVYSFSFGVYADTNNQPSIIRGADNQFTTSVSSASHPENTTATCIPANAADGTMCAELIGLPALLESVILQLPASYFPVRAGDGVHWSTLVPVSGVLKNLVDAIPLSFFPVRAADGIQWTTLKPVSGPIATLVNAIPAYYFPVRALDGNLLFGLTYPTELLADTIPPRIFNFRIDRISGLVEWETDTFANSEVRNGKEFGNYASIGNSALWVKQHVIPIAEPEGEFFLVRSIDQSGNVGEYYSPGYSISGKVLDDNGDPVPDVLVSVSPSQVAITNSNGEYNLQGIPPGNHVIHVYQPGYAFTPESIPVSLTGDLLNQNFVGESASRSTYFPSITR